MADEYRSTERYTIEKVTSMGVELTKVTNSSGMVTAILLDEDFAAQFEPIE